MSRSSPSASALRRGSVLFLAASVAVGCTGTINDTLDYQGAEPARQSSGPPPGGPDVPGMAPSRPDVPMTISAAPTQTTRFARLSHAQWENSVRTLLNLDRATTRLSAAFLGDPIAGFDNSGSLLRVAPDLWDDYQRGAEAAADLVTKSPALLAKLIPPGSPTDLAGQGRAFVQSIGKRAYRRPLEEAETTAYVALFNQGPMLVDASSPFAAGASLVIRALLQSPFFLYRTELGTASAGGRVLLSDWEVASKLSFALTNGMPDDELFAAAAAKSLQTHADVEAQAKRLLESPAALAMIDSFHGQHLQLPRYEGISTKDKTAYPDVQTILAKLPEDAKQETLAFAREIFRNGLGLRELLTAPFTMVNARLASVYGLPGTFEADKFTRVDLDPARRAGILTQIGFLASAAYSVQPDPIHRGIFVLEQLACGQVPDPPDNIPPLPATVLTGKTNRQIWESHTDSPACAGCHKQLINPVGFAFEEFDAIGRHRTMDNGVPVDASGSIHLGSDRKTFTGVAGLAKTLADSAEASACYARAWHSYLHGQAVEPAGEVEVLATARALQKPGASLKSAVLGVVVSSSFLTRTP